LIERGYYLVLDRSPGQTLRCSVPMRATRKPPEEPPETAETKRGQLTALLSEMPDQGGTAAVQLAKQVAPLVGVSEHTARKYIGQYRAQQAAS
jgi:hypothetical protein